MKFIHAADLHIDSPLRGLGAYDGAPVDRLRGATRDAFIALVELAIEQCVDFVILAGDIYDGNWTDFRTGLFFREQTVKLVRSGIRVFVTKGNHDAESQITRQLPAVEGVHVFSSRKCDTVEIEELGVALHSRSFPERAVTEDLVSSYPDAIPGKFNIGILHTSLTGNLDHDPYAPTTVEALCSKGYDYFALGHIHAREVVRESNPRIIFPGNLQGRHAKETGPKGCELVTVSEGRLESEFVPLDVVRWHQHFLDITGVSTLDALAKLLLEQLEYLVSEARDRLHAVRVVVGGESSLHHLEAEQPGTIAAAIQAAAQDIDGGDVWIEQVKLELRSPFDRAAAALRMDAHGEVVRLIDALAADEGALKSWFVEQLADGPSLPRDLMDVDPATLSIDEIRSALIDAEATVLAQLSEITGSGSST